MHYLNNNFQSTTFLKSTRGIVPISLLLSLAGCSSDSNELLPVVEPEEENPPVQYVAEGGLPQISAIDVVESNGSYSANFSVAFTEATDSEGIVSDEEYKVALFVYDGRENNGKLGQVIQLFELRDSITDSHEELFSIELTQSSVTALGLETDSPNQHNLRVSVVHDIFDAPHILSPGLYADHKKLASTSWAGNPGVRLVNKAANKATAASSQKDDDIQPSTTQPSVTLHNDSGVPINLYEYDLMCIYDNNENDSDPSGFNAQQDASLKAGGTIEQFPSANGSFFDDADYLGPAPETVKTTLTQYGLKAASKAASLLNMPVISNIISSTGSCGSNVSSFGIIATSVEDDGVGSNQAWVITSQNGSFEQNSWFTGPGCSDCAVGLATLDSASWAEVWETQDSLIIGFWEDLTHQMFAAMMGSYKAGITSGTEYQGDANSETWMKDYGLSWETSSSGDNAFVIKVKMAGDSNMFPLAPGN